MKRDRLAVGSRILLGWGLIIAAVVLLAVGWYGVSGTAKVERQLSYLVSGGIGGLLAGIVGIGFLVSTDVRRDRERLGRVEAAVLELRELIVAQSEAKKQPDGLNGNGSEPADDGAAAKARPAARKRRTRSSA